MFQQLAPILFAQLRTIGAFEEGCLFGEDEIGSWFGWQQFHCRVGRRDTAIAERHGIGNYKATVGHNVAVNSIVRAGKTLRAKGRTLTASDAKIHFALFGLEIFIPGKPAAFLGGIGESGEHTLWGSRIAAFNHEGAVSNGSLVHDRLLTKLAFTV